MKNKITQSHLDLILKIISARLTSAELTKVKAEAQRIKRKQ